MLSVVALAVVTVAWMMINVYTGVFSLSSQSGNSGEDYPGITVSPDSKSVTGITPLDQYSEYEYNFYGKVRKVENIEPGFNALILDTTDAGVPIFAIFGDTRIEKTSVAESVPAAVSDLEEGINVSVTAVFSVAEKQWTTKSILIPSTP